MEVSINFPSLISGLIMGLVIAFFITYIWLKSSIEKNNLDINQQKKEMESFGLISAHTESNYKQKIEILEAEIKNLTHVHAQSKAKLEMEISSLKESHKDEIKQAREELTIVTYPYKEESGEDGMFSDDRTAEVGYKFQMFIRGIPCFEAHKVPVEKLHKKQVSLEKIKTVTNEVINLLESIAKRHPAIAVADKFAKIKKI